MRCLAGTRAQRRARGEGTRTHAKARADGRRHCLQGAAAARAKFEAGIGAGKMGAEPVSASGALRIDALHGPTGQILHMRVLRWPPSPVRGSPGGEMNCDGEYCAGARWVSRENGHKI
jgi:hypothetical protein